MSPDLKFWLNCTAMKSLTNYQIFNFLADCYGHGMTDPEIVSYIKDNFWGRL